MKVSYRKSLLVNCAFLGSIAFGSIGSAKPAGAQAVYAPASNQPVAITVPPTLSANAIADAKLATRVKDALHSDPYRRRQTCRRQSFDETGGRSLAAAAPAAADRKRGLGSASHSQSSQ